VSSAGCGAVAWLAVLSLEGSYVARLLD